jgi:hypothetical protein
MKPAYTSSYKSEKDEIIKKYPPFLKYFAELEDSVCEKPLESTEELIFLNGKKVCARKKHIKTTFFSGLLRDTYYYLTVTYLLTNDDRAVFVHIGMHDYIN